MRRFVAALGILMAAACASNRPLVPDPQEGSLAVKTLLVDLNVRSGWAGTTRYLVSYTPQDRDGQLQLSGRRSGNRKVSWNEVARLGTLVLESGILVMPYRKPTCDDCTVWEVQVRLNDQVSGLVAFWEGEPDPLPPLIDEILKVGR